MKKKYNWKEIQKLYDTGITISQVCEIFGCKPSGVYSATKRGEFIPRDKSDCQTSKQKMIDERLRELSLLYSSGNSLREILELGFSQAEYIHARKMGLFQPRDLRTAHKLRLEKHGPNVMGEEARKNLSIRQSLNNSGGKCKWFEVSGQRVQGTWERNIANKFNEMGIKWIKLKTHKDILFYTYKDSERAYTPDFYLPDFDVYLEVKGYWWGDDRNKMDIVIKQHPDKKIIIIEKSEYKRIMQGEQVW